MAGSSRRNLAIAVVVFLLAVVVGLGLQIYRASDRWDQTYQVRLVASSYGKDGKPSVDPVAYSWRIGGAPATPQGIYYELEFRGDEPGWRPFPTGATTFQDVVDALFPGRTLARTYWPLLDEAGQAALLAQLPKPKPGAFAADAWPLAVTTKSGEIDPMILLVALRKDGERVVLPIRSGDPDQWVVSSSFSAQVVQDPAAQKWIFRPGGPRVTAKNASGFDRLQQRGARFWEGTLRINVGPKVERER